MNDRQPLHDLWVVVTRPVDQAEGLCKAIKNNGGHVIPWPVLQIQPIEETDQTRQHIAALKTYDHIIFISANAVNHGLKAISRHGVDLKKADVFAVGKTTAKALQDAGINNVHVPAIASSKGLLALPVFQSDHITGKRCLIFRGKGGNEKLATGLKQRGAAFVDYAEVYERHRADSDPAILEAHWQQNKLDIIIITSVAGLDNLFAILGKKNQSQLLSTPLLVVSERIATSAKQRGFHSPLLIAKSAIDEAIIETMQTWHQKGAG